MKDKSPQIEALMSRRQWLSGATQLAAAGALSIGLLGCQGRSGQVCGDPARLSQDEANLRDSLHYVEQSTAAGQHCSGCAFYEPAGGQSCGNCKMLKGPVNPNGHCDSWSKAQS